MKNKKYRGFTLVEMIISLAILGVVLTPICTMLLVSDKSNKDGQTKQTASLRGQDVFEQIKNADIEEVKDENQNIILSKIGDIDISSLTEDGANVGTKDFGDGYKAKVELVKNTSINLQKDNSNDDAKFNNFSFSLGYYNSQDINSLIVSSNNSSAKGALNFTNQDEVLKLAVFARTVNNEKIVTIKNSNNNEIIPPEKLTVQDDQMNNQIEVSLNFDNYKVFSTTDTNKLRGIELSTYNEDDIPLNICLQKSSDLDVSVANKLGNVRVFNNRSGNPDNPGQLYNIKVTVTQNINGEDKAVFTEQTSQNIKVNQEG